MKPDIKTREDIRILIDTFYENAAHDSLLAAIFRGLAKSSSRNGLYKYWEEVLLNDESEMSAHFPPHIERMFTRQHFIRWRGLFMHTIDALYSGPNADKTKVVVIRKSEEFQSSVEILRF